ncbi:ATP-dependent protease ATPase subunit HslU [Rickettsiales bacterium]|nr:ATP-dependent protease ATPase subunit HslU [Rickettsiales bacterium]
MSDKINLTQNLTPKEIVSQLDRYIIGQDLAKKSVAISLRNRYRRKQVDNPLREEIVPKNILSIGPTGVGKTEIARRLAKLVDAPFIKVEATKFTEVGYVGRDVESIIRDLVEIAINQVSNKKRKDVQEKAKDKAKDIILDALVGEESSDETREKFKKLLETDYLDDKEIEIEVKESYSPSPFSSTFDVPGGQASMLNIGDVIGKAIGGDKKKKTKLKIIDAKKVLVEEESENLIDKEEVTRIAVDLVENEAIIFIDEFDKICAKGANNKGGEVSREGVQRDLLPLVEGTAVNTKYGVINTDYILFIASGAFHIAKPSDLLPELQGRFPIRVELQALTEKDLVRILTEPESSLIKQYVALMAVENVQLDFVDNGIKQIAKIANKLNSEVENIGARRLYTLLEKILEEVSFNNCNCKKKVIVTIDKEFVDKSLSEFIGSKIDLSRFIL